MTTALAGQGPGMTLPNIRLVAGIGCTSAARADDIIALVETCLARLGAGRTSLIAIASHTRKAGDPALIAAARHFDVPLCLLGDNDLAETVPNPSAMVQAAIGRPSIAEAAAAAIGPLLLPKQKSAHVTCALALCDAGFDPLALAQPSSSSAAMAASMLSTSRAGP